MATDFRNSRWWRPPSWVPVSMQIQCNICVLCHVLNIPNKVGDNLSKSKEMATDFRNSRLWPPPSWIPVSMQNQCNICVFCHIINIPTKFGDDWFKMAAAAILNFENRLPFLHYRTNPHQIWWKCWESDIERNCLVEKRTFTTIQDGGCHRLEFRKAVAISLLLDQSSPNLVGMLHSISNSQHSHQIWRWLVQ